MVYDPKFYVRGAVPACRERGCVAPEMARMLQSLSSHEREVMRILQEKGTPMEPTKALWCEQGGHSFSEKDPDYQVLSISGKDKDGKPVTESRTLCGPCASQAKVNLGSARNNPAAQIPAGSEEQR